MVEERLKLKAAYLNKNTITWEQVRLDNVKTSVLDFIFTSAEIKEFSKLEKFESDHYPIMIKTKMHTEWSKVKKHIIKKIKIKMDQFAIKKILDKKEWPSSNNAEYNKSILYKKLIIRPTAKLQSKLKDILDSDNDWENKSINIRAAWSESFRNYVKDLDIWRTSDSAKFYKIVNSLINYKNQNKIVNGIKTKEWIIVGDEWIGMVRDYYKKLFEDTPQYSNIESNGKFDYFVDIERAIGSIAMNKASGLDLIPGDLFKNTEMRTAIWERMKEHFGKYTREWQVPTYFMKARLALLSKEETNMPEIENTRPISILPAVTKLFEISILHNLEKATKLDQFNKLQRGFMKNWSTCTNIEQLLELGNAIKNRRSANRTDNAAFVFFDFHKAYDSVPRDILIQKLKSFEIPWNIIKLIKNMLENFTLVYEGTSITTKKGLVQGSTLSPLLFNLFINDLLNIIDLNHITTLGYADDIVWICENMDQVKKSIEIMRAWTLQNRMIVNPKKSGILRILRRKGKWLHYKNWLDIPEVTSYWYLGIRITQSLKLNEHEQRLKAVESNLTKKLQVLKPSLVSTKSRFLVYKTILKSKLLYAAKTISKYSKTYRDKLNSMLYRILKKLFWIKTNVKKQLLLEVLDPTEENLNDNWGINLIELLSLKSIKLKLGCLFSQNPKNKKCNWPNPATSNHIIKDWNKAKIWRMKWNNTWYIKTGMSFSKLISTVKSINIKHLKLDKKELAEFVNMLTEELFKDYLA